jgi:hypothetical protein
VSDERRPPVVDAVDGDEVDGATGARESVAGVGADEDRPAPLDRGVEFVAVDLNREADVERDGDGGVDGVAGALAGVVAVALVAGLAAVGVGSGAPLAIAAVAFVLTGYSTALPGRDGPRRLGGAAADLFGFLVVVGLVAWLLGLTTLGSPLAGVIGGAFGIGAGFLREDLTLDADSPTRTGVGTTFAASRDGLTVRRPDEAHDLHVPWTAVAAVERTPEAIHVRLVGAPDLAPATADLDDPDAVAAALRAAARGASDRRDADAGAGAGADA